MTDADADLTRLFAAVAERPSDEAFVADVSARVARERRLAAMRAGALSAAAIAALVIFGQPVGLGLALLGAAAGVCADVFAGLMATPAGWVACASVALAVWMAFGTARRAT